MMKFIINADHLNGNENDEDGDISTEEIAPSELEILLNDYAVLFEENPKALDMALHALEGMEDKWQIHALKAAITQEMELHELADDLKFWRRGYLSTSEELEKFKADYARIFGERASVTAEELIAGMEDSAKAFAYQFSTLHNVKFEDIKELLTMWNWTFSIMTTSFQNVMDSQELFEERLKRAGQVAAGNLSQSSRPILDAVKQISHTVQGLALSVKDIEHSAKGLADTAYKEFKAKVNPEHLKRALIDGAAAGLTEKLITTIKETVKIELKKELGYKRHIGNIAMASIFCFGMVLGKYFF